MLDNLPVDDNRRNFPRFQLDVFDLNLKLVQQLEQISRKKGMSLPQTAIAWVLAQNKAPGAPHIVPIPGCTTVARVEEDLTVTLDEEDLNNIDAVLKEIPVHGDRYGGALAKLTNL